MKFKFKIQEYQTQAVNAVVNVFEGQPFCDHVEYRSGAESTLQNGLSFLEDSPDYFEYYFGSGFGNAEIRLSDEQLLENVRTLQFGNDIKQSSQLSKPFGNNCRCALDIEMETGTGKTYCYIKTIFQLNKKYGWSKFIVVVPSIAIREGVKKSFEVMEDHFFQQYGKKARYFVYNSKNLNQLDAFSGSKDIHVMIINAQAFASSMKEGAKNDAARLIYSKQDSFGSRRPIDVIAATRPVVILDEPQKLGGDATQKGIERFCPLFALNYSATHRQEHNLVYVLDALDAYKKKLVKKIEVKGFELRNIRGTDGFVYLSEIIVDAKRPPVARLAFEVNRANGIARESRIIKVNDNLYNLSASGKMPPLEQYKNGFIVADINPKNNTVTFLNGQVLAIGEVVGDISEQEMRRIQIRETILSHFEKEEKLFKMGIKCLSLFFIDEVAHYRRYGEDGNEVLGDFGIMFEEEYLKIAQEWQFVNEDYARYVQNIAVGDTHKGYFSIDKKTKRVINSEVKRGGGCDDISAYDLILKNKERLLSFDEPTRFIFSHSALREGWDNPNVFQICTLKQSSSEVNKRQEVGRGMRLCVNSAGDRIDSSVSDVNVHDVNVLTVVASDSYKTFVADLQKEINANLRERPTKATPEYFEGKRITIDGKPHEIGIDEARKIWHYLVRNGYVDDDDNVTDLYRSAQASGSFAEMPDAIKGLADGVHKLVQGVFDEKECAEMVTDANKSKMSANELNENFAKKEFQALWKQINHKYAYTVAFDSEELVQKVVEAINEQLYVPTLTYVRTIGTQQNDSYNFKDEKTQSFSVESLGGNSAKYDLVGKICHGTNLTRKTVAAILKRITAEKFNCFKRNPEKFISETTRIINEQKATMIVEEITYNVTAEEPYSSDIFTAHGVAVNWNKALRAKKHITPWIVTDSETELNFAQDLERNEGDVCVYAKLPRSFKIPTPVGDYSPDWAIAFYEGKVKYVYFIAETKGSMESLQLKKVESAKIECAKKLFATLNGGSVHYDVADTYQHLMDIMSK